LAGIPQRRGLVRRPLLRLRRADTHELCAQLAYAPVQDPMNGDLRHRRVWLRREIIPALERGADRDIVDVLARQAELLRDDHDLLEAMAAERSTDDAKALAAMPTPLARRVLRQQLGSPPPSAATIERVLAVARGERLATEVAGGATITRVGGRLVQTPPQPRGDGHAGHDDAEPRPEETRWPLPGRATFGTIAFEAWIEHAPPVAWPDGRWVAVCDADTVADVAVIRRGRRLPVVHAGGPLWSVGYRVDRRVRVTARTRRFLWLSAEPARP
jgi:hypothetical protein